MAETYNQRVVKTIQSRNKNIDSVLGGLFTPQELAAIKERAGLATASDSKTKKPSTMVYPAVSSDTDANAKITAAFQNLLGRDPSKEELDNWRPKLQKAQKANAATQKYTKAGDVGTQASVTGLNEAQWLKEQLSALPKYQKELKEAALTPKNLAQKANDKKLYMDALAEAKGDPAKIATLNQSTNYGLDIEGLKIRIKNAADAAGATYDEADLLNWAREAYDTNKDQDSAIFDQFVNSKLQFAGAGYKGKALSTFTALRDTALANGMDVNKLFGAQLPQWVKAVNDGANIEEFKQRIRDVAKIGLPERIGKLIDSGIDLDVIYSPYQGVMESVLELPRGSVRLDDPTLRAAITQQGEVPIYEFERQLRNDPRWGFTDAARQQAASTALDILRNFGFQG